MDDQRGPAAMLDLTVADPQPAGQADVLSEPVPHAQPLTTEPLTREPLTREPLTREPLDREPLTDEQLNQQISEMFSEIIKYAHDLGQSIATEFGLTGSDAMALFKLDAPMTMKELGQKMGCDPSFITTIADALEKHGLARREPSLRDRRSKNLVLTPEGVTVRDRVCQELMARAPWCTALDTGERRCLLGLMRKMLKSRGGR